MTDAEWRSCTSLNQLLKDVGGESTGWVPHLLRVIGYRPMRRPKPRVGERKLRLLACAFARQVWHLLTDGRSRRLVEVAERFADGLTDGGELAGAMHGAWAAFHQTIEEFYAWGAETYAARAAACVAGGAESAAEEERPESARWEDVDAILQALMSGEEIQPWREAPRVGVRTLWVIAQQVGWALNAARDPAGAEVRRTQCELVRDIIPPPGHAGRVDPAWLAWDGGTVPRLARAVHEEGRFGEMPVLGDALEEAGCTDSEVLAHLRGPGPHVRGCRALDALLGKG